VSINVTSQQHLNVRKHICPVCGKKFNKSFHLFRHSELHMSTWYGQTRFCYYSFTSFNKVNLTRTCWKCDVNFTIRADYLEHIKFCRIKKDRRIMFEGNEKDLVKLWKTDKKQFACGVCSLEFQTQAKLNYHMKIHTR
jgi:hypothetical protein